MRQVDATKLNALDECPRKAELRFEKNLVPLSEKSIAKEFGKSIHIGLGVRYNKKGNPVVSFTESFTPFIDPTDEKGRTPEKGAELLAAYGEKFAQEEWKDIGGEISFALDFGDFQYVGLVDRVGEHYDRLAFQEWKTSTRPWEFTAKPNIQITGYAKAILDYYGEIPEGLVTMMGIYKTSVNGVLPARGKYGARSVINRELVEITRFELLEWEKDVLAKLAAIVRYEKEGYWPKNTRSCGAFGGCVYKAVCEAPEEQRAYLLESNFKEEIWDPLMEVR